MPKPLSATTMRTYLPGSRPALPRRARPRLGARPGGADSAAIIAASSGKADLVFVMTLQIARAISALFLGPPLARFVGRRFGERSAQGQGL
jgi:Transition state regulatory protein AbrB